MLRTFPSSSRGLTKLSWLTSYHCFSFNTFRDLERMQFGPLRVLNDDTVAPGAGFGAHPHENMEIVTYVMRGALEHRDSTGGHGVINAGDVQRMRAGTGIVHSEFNNSQIEPVHFLQVWFFPDRDGLEPGYEQVHFDPEQRRNALLSVASSNVEEGGVHIQTPSRMFIASIDSGKSIAYPLAADRGAYVYVIEGGVAINGAAATRGDAVQIIDEDSMELHATSDVEVVVFDVER